MKEINSFQLVKVPEGIEATVKSRTITIKGPRGSLSKSFKHLAVDIYMTDKETIKIEKWFGKKKQLAAVRTVCSHINNLFKGVTKVTYFNLLDLFATEISSRSSSCIISTTCQFFPQFL